MNLVGGKNKEKVEKFFFLVKINKFHTDLWNFWTKFFWFLGISEENINNNEMSGFFSLDRHLLAKYPIYSAIIKFRSINESTINKNEGQASLLTLIFYLHVTPSFFLNQAYSESGLRLLLMLQYEKKCNLTLAMSPTCHSNNTLAICWHEFFWECSQSQLAQCKIYRSSMGLSVSSYRSPRVAFVKIDF